MAALCQSFARCHRKLIDLLEHKISILNETQGGGGSMAGPIIREWNQYGSAIDDDSTELYAIGLPKTKVNAIASIADDAKEEMVEQERYWTRLAEDVKEDTEGVEEEAERWAMSK